MTQRRSETDAAQKAGSDPKADPVRTQDAGLLRWLHGPYAASKKRAAERRDHFETSSGIEVAPLYGDSSRGLPGEYPFLRGVRPSMYRSQFWTMRQYAGFSSARETNRRFKLLLDSGQTGLSTAFDLPTQIGYDSDHDLAKYEVGLVGVPINSLRDVEHLFAGIPLGEVSTSMTINATATILLSLYCVAAKKQGVERSKLRGTVQNDILKEYAARGNYRFPTQPSMRLTTDLMAFCASEIPQWNTISISGYHIREAGSNAVQEIAFTLGNGRAYVRAALAAGLAIDDFAPRLSFFFNAHNNLFEEVAKFRAARRMWSRIMREEFGAKDEKSWMLRFHTQTAGSMLTSQQPENNVVRVTLQALAAVLGGTQSLHTNGLDEALSLPTEKSARIALRTQQIIANESGVCDTVDPLGGAPFIESLTDELEAGARALIAEVDRRGGMVAAIEAGFVQREIQKSAMAWLRAVESNHETIVGVNSYVIEEKPPELFRASDDSRRQVLADLENVRKERDPVAVEASLRELDRAAAGTENVMPHMIAAVERYVTLGEICGVFEKRFGKYKPPEVL